MEKKRIHEMHTYRVTWDYKIGRRCVPQERMVRARNAKAAVAYMKHWHEDQAAADIRRLGFPATRHPFHLRAERV